LHPSATAFTGNRKLLTSTKHSFFEFWHPGTKQVDTTATKNLLRSISS